MEAGGLDDDETGAAFGPRLVIGNEVLARKPTLGEVGLVAGREDAIADLRVAQLEGGEEAGEGSHAARSSLGSRGAQLHTVYSGVMRLSTSAPVGVSTIVWPSDMARFFAASITIACRNSTMPEAAGMLLPE